MCPICYNIPRNIVCCVEKVHFFCCACILKALAKKRSCPCCRTYLMVATLKTHTWAIAALGKAVVISATRYYSSGKTSSSFMSAGATTLDSSLLEEAVVARCGWTGLEDLNKHMLGCLYDLLACPKRAPIGSSSSTTRPPVATSNPPPHCSWPPL